MRWEIKMAVGNIPADVFKSATGLAGGVARPRMACGALTGSAVCVEFPCINKLYPHRLAVPDTKFDREYRNSD